MFKPGTVYKNDQDKF